jgi:hypothetical protein
MGDYIRYDGYFDIFELIRKLTTMLENQKIQGCTKDEYGRDWHGVHVPVIVKSCWKPARALTLGEMIENEKRTEELLSYG